MGKRIIIIDGNSLINRAFYAMQRPMITSEGIYTQGVYGFINMLQKLEGDYDPDYLTVAFDLKAPTFRHLEYDAYKAGRKAMPPELVMQMPIMKDVLHAMNIETLEMDGFLRMGYCNNQKQLKTALDIFSEWMLTCCPR